MKTNKTFVQRNWVFATYLNFLIPLSLQPDGVNICCKKIKLSYLTEFEFENDIGLQRYID